MTRRSDSFPVDVQIDRSHLDPVQTFRRVRRKHHHAHTQTKSSFVDLTKASRRTRRLVFPTSIPVEVAIAGLRLVLAGGVYRPLPILKETDTPGLATTGTYADVTEGLQSTISAALRRVRSANR
jgi:hypothetical protein